MNHESSASGAATTVGNDGAKGTSNLALGVIAGVVTSLVGALIWAGITVVTDFQIGWMAVGVGMLVGFAVGYFNREGHAVFGVLGAFFALFGCLLGNALTIVGVVASQEHVSFLKVVMEMSWGEMPSMMRETFSAMDLLFYAIAIYEGYRFGAKGRVS